MGANPGPAIPHNNHAEFEELELDGDDTDPIAICGFSIKFPQDATSPEAFWKMLIGKRCAMTEFPLNRLNTRGFNHKENRSNTFQLRGGHFIEDDLSVFDADFFSISPTEASAMDPMQRWLLEAAYRALENAGIPMESISGSSTAVYTGSFSMDYMIQLYRDAENPPMHAALGLGLSMLANRLSWFFNLRGPSIGLDTACSSATTAVDLAAQALGNRSCDMAMVAGCNLTFSPEYFTWMTNLNFLSPDSRCYSFDHRANGYARGEGIGVIILKRLSDAIQNGDTIRGVIRSTGCNEDGRTPGITQPSSEAQEHLIHETYRRAGLSMAHTRYFEAHGTGTPLGDPLEAQAIGAAFQDYRSTSDPIYVGASKSNIGHLEGASGIASIVKAVLVLEKGVIPPNANFEKPNPKIDLLSLFLNFPKESHPWPTNGLRRASINSFGYGGSNSHIVIDDAYHYLRLRNLSGNHCTTPSPTCVSLDTGPINGPSRVRAIKACRPKLLVWSASDRDGLDRIAKQYEDYANPKSSREEMSDDFLDNLAYTLDSRRSRLPWRSFAVLESPTELQSLQSRISSPVQASTPTRVGYIFSGQGAQWFAMGRELMSYSSFSEDISYAGQFLKDLGCKWSVTDELLKTEETSRINDTEFSQTLCTVLQVALVNLLARFGLRPSAVAGHSSGEIAAAYAGGYISFESALKLAYFRGLCSAELSNSPDLQHRGAMLAVGSSEDSVKDEVATLNQGALSFGLSIACINSPNSVTIAGEHHLIDQLKERLDEQKIFARKLHVTVAYHSQQMSLISAKYAALISHLSKGKTPYQVPMVSSVTGDQISEDRLIDVSYWISNMESPVQFSRAIVTMCAESGPGAGNQISPSSAPMVNHLLEIGPHATLQGPIREILLTIPRKNIGYSSLLRRNQSALVTMLTAAGQLHCSGVDLNLRVINEPTGEGLERSLLVNLPEYPFDHSRSYWHESRLSRNYRLREHPPSEFLGVRSRDWDPSQSCWRHFVRTTDLPWVEDHVIDGTVLYPAGGMLVMAIEATKQLIGKPDSIVGYALRDVLFESPMDLTTNNGTLEVQTYLSDMHTTDRTNPTYEFVVKSFTKDDAAVINCRGFISSELSGTSDSWTLEKGRSQRKDLLNCFSILHTDGGDPVESRQMYDFLRDYCGYEYGPCFRVAQNQRYASDRKQAAAQIALFRSATDEHVIHPVSLDALFHLPCTALTSGGSAPIATSIPTRVGYLWVSNRGLAWPEKDMVNCCSEVTNVAERGFTCNGIATESDSKNVVLYYDGLELTSITDDPKLNPELPNSQQFCMHVECKIALDKLEPEEICTILDELHPATQNWANLFQDLEVLVQASLSRFLVSVETPIVNEKDPWRLHYWKWAKYNMNQSQRKHIWDSLDSESLYELTKRVENANHIGRLYVAVAANLMGLWRGEVDPLELLIHSGLLGDCYKEWNDHSTAMQISSYVDLLAHQTPGLKILEVGGGTGSGTRNIVNALCARPGDPEGFLRCSRYDFTDVSAAFLDRAREEFRHYHSQMTFGVLDIERDFTEQGFPAGQYDVLLAVSVLHISRDLISTVKRIRQALQPGGKLIMQESFTPSGWTLGYIFGLFPGWWMGVEDNRVLSPSISIDAWDTILRENGFSGVDIVRDLGQEGAFHYGWIISTATEELPSPSIQRPRRSVQISMIIDEDCPQQQLLAEAIMLVPVISSIKSEELLLGKSASEFTILLVDYGKSYLKSVDEPGWERLKALIRKSRSLLWVSSAGDQTASPDQGMIDGLARTLRTEYYELHLVTLALENSETRGASGRFLHLTRIIEEMLSKAAHENYEQEYIEINGRLHTRRLVEANYLKSAVDKKISPYEEVPTRIGNSAQFALSKSIPGLQGFPRYVEAPLFSPVEPRKDDVDILVKAAVVQDRSSAVGYGESQIFGRYYSGIVIKAGRDASFHPGDTVVVVSPSYSSHLRVSSQALTRIPSSSISFPDACWALPPVVAAYTSLVEVGQVRSDDSILVCDGASLVGLACLQLLATLGVDDVWTTAADESENSWIASKLDIPKDRIIPKSWVRNPLISTPTWRQRFHVVLANEMVTPILSTSFVKPGGRYITLRTKSAPMKDTQKIHDTPANISLSILDLTETLPSRDALSYAAGNVSRLAAIVEKNQISQFPASSLESALDRLRSTNNKEAVVVRFDDDDVVNISVPTRPRYELYPQGAYLIAGGLGGLGRGIARWLVSRGARYLILLSRTGPKTPEALDLLAELEGKNVQVEAPSCDISDRIALRSILTKCGKRMPLIRGCIQASMVLTESSFQEISFRDWEAAVTPKVIGSWNLHTELPKGLDFFIMISSVQGILGTALLSGYNAGNTYQDALAKHRILQGERAVSLDLGGVSDIGFISENTRYKTIFQRNKRLAPLTLQEVCALLDTYCDPKTSPSQNTTSCQSVVGISQPAIWKSDDDSFTIKQPFWGHIHHVPLPSGYDQEREFSDVAGSAKRRQAINPAIRLAATKSVTEAAQVVSESLVYRIHTLLGTDKNRVDLEKPMYSYGIDSLSAIDLRNWISKVFDVDMPVFEILGGVTFASAAMSIAEKVRART
ncbi:putative polyketide synthase [Hypoxylon sp. EC38]|nr:putative polyketide synthase [Hypoxylon sp. EC38]